MVDRQMAAKVAAKNLTYVNPSKMNSLFDCVDELDASDIHGDFLEFGVALGGSGICLAKSLQADRRYFGFDVFGMIPAPSAIDGQDVLARYKTIVDGKSEGIGGEPYYGYVDNLFDVVKANFHSFGCPVDDERIFLIKGLFADTLPKHYNLQVALSHIDCDWYDPVSYCLAFVWPRLSEGGYIVLDDYNEWSGCRKATDHFLKFRPEAKCLRFHPHAVIQKPLSSRSV